MEKGREHGGGVWKYILGLGAEKGNRESGRGFVWVGKVGLMTPEKLGK